jgi:hypothetical protein
MKTVELDEVCSNMIDLIQEEEMYETPTIKEVGEAA